MDEYFSFGTTNEDPIADYRVNDLVERAETAPVQESMRGQRTRTNAPSTDEKKVKRRQIHRSGGYLDENDWDKNLSRIDSIHRGIGLHLPDDLHRFVHDESKPVEDRAHALLQHVTGEREGDSRSGLGPHWTSEKRVAEDFAEKDAQHKADTHEHSLADSKDFTWGKRDPWGDGPDDVSPAGKPGTAVVIHGPTPQREDISDEGQGEGGMVYNWEDHGEKEVNLHKGAQVPVTGVSWAHIRSDNDVDKEWLPEYTHHTFSTPQGHHASKTATVIPTRVERFTKGQNIRTPTGQTVKVHQVRPHETDSSLVYLDTEMGTSTVKKGTELQSVDVNSQQQEMPDTGNPMNEGNTGQLPGAGHGPGGPGAGKSGKPASQGACPNCGNSGTLHLQGSSYICSVCGFTVGAGGTPGGLLFTNQPRGVPPARRKPGETNVQTWASKYDTTDGISQIARRARQVLGGEQ